MIKISREEVLHIASLSRIELTEDEIPGVIKDLEEVLTYASRVQEVAAEAPAYDKNINVYRDDTIVATDPNPILANVPKREENYVVVPVVLE
jgi:aspartyl-tRNA(Asn)/glutamyl-tRNA(Gln) amidotransferase subunit C